MLFPEYCCLPRCRFSAWRNETRACVTTGHFVHIWCAFAIGRPLLLPYLSFQHVKWIAAFCLCCLWCIHCQVLKSYIIQPDMFPDKNIKDPCWYSSRECFNFSSINPHLLPKTCGWCTCLLHYIPPASLCAPYMKTCSTQLRSLSWFIQPGGSEPSPWQHGWIVIPWGLTFDICWSQTIVTNIRIHQHSLSAAFNCIFVYEYSPWQNIEK